MFILFILLDPELELYFHFFNLNSPERPKSKQSETNKSWTFAPQANNALKEE